MMSFIEDNMVRSDGLYSDSSSSLPLFRGNLGNNLLLFLLSAGKDIHYFQEKEKTKEKRARPINN